MKLAPGKHTLTLVFRNRDGVRTNMGQRVAGVWVTNDASFVPPDYTAQVMFQNMPSPSVSLTGMLQVKASVWLTLLFAGEGVP